MLERNLNIMKINNILLSLLILFICLVVSIVCFFEQINGIYKYIFLLPIVYCVLFLIILNPLMKKSKSYTVKIFTFCCALRYVLHPLLLSLYPIYGFSRFENYNINSINMALFLMMYELIICSLLLKYFCYNFTIPNKVERYIDLPNGNVIIIGFIIIALLIFFIIPETRSRISFFALKTNTNMRISAIQMTTFKYFLEQIFQIGRLALYIVIVVICQNKFRINKKKRYIIFAFLVSVLNMGIIIGEARSVQVQFGFAAVYLLSQCFPEYSRKMSNILIITAGLIIILMTIYKQFYAFKYDSYLTAIINFDIDMYEITKTSEIYLLGPQSVSSAMMLKNLNIEFNIKRLLFDFVRSFMGLNFIAKKIDMQTTSVIYNLFVTNGYSTNGYLIPITAQGYLYFGWILSPILLCLFLKLSLFLEKTFRTSQSAYTIFFMAYLFARSSTCIVASNINTVITNVSMFLLSAGIIYFIQKLVPFKLILRKDLISSKSLDI